MDTKSDVTAEGRELAKAYMTIVETAKKLDHPLCDMVTKFTEQLLDKPPEVQLAFKREYNKLKKRE